MSKPLSSWFFWITLLVAFGVYFFPLRGDANFWRPLPVFMVTIFWLLREPHELGLGFAWSVGLVLDIVGHGVWGQHALGLLVCAYLLQLAGERMHHFTVWHQMVVVSGLALAYQMLVVLIYLMAGKEAHTLQMFYPVVTSVLAWPLMAGLMYWLYRPS